MNYFLQHSDFLYTRIMLFSWECESDLTNFSETNGEFFVSQLDKNLKVLDINTIVVNCNNVLDIDDHFIDPILKYQKDKGLDIILYSDDSSIKLPKYCSEHIDNNGVNVFLREGERGVYYFCSNSISSSKLSELIDEAELLEQKKVVNLIKESYSEKKQELSSTPLLASGIFNATKLLSDPSKFRWLTLLMVDGITKCLMKERAASCSIVSSSLRGASIAGSVREIIHFLVPTELFLFDHIGPKHDFNFNPNHKEIKPNSLCIYIGDFLIAGTELKVTQAYCNLFSGKIDYAFVLGKYTRKDKLCGDINVHSLVQLKECVSNLKYELE